MSHNAVYVKHATYYEIFFFHYILYRIKKIFHFVLKISFFYLYLTKFYSEKYSFIVFKNISNGTV